MMASQTSMRFEKIVLLPNVFFVNISNCLLDQTPLSKSSKLFLHVDVVTQILGKRDYVGNRAEVYLFWIKTEEALETYGM